MCFCLLSSLTNQPLECFPPSPRTLMSGKGPWVPRILLSNCLAVEVRAWLETKMTRPAKMKIWDASINSSNMIQYVVPIPNQVSEGVFTIWIYLREDGGRDQLSNEGFTLLDAPFPFPSFPSSRIPPRFLKRWREEMELLTAAPNSLWFKALGLAKKATDETKIG